MAKKLTVQAGTLLAAWPDLRDPNFMHTVVLMCQHSSEGAYGLVTNRKSDFRVRELLPEHKLLGSCDFPVHLGGPVDHTTMQFVHVVPDQIPGGVSLDGELWIGGELESMARFLIENPDRAPRSLRLFLGYSGWGAGQLEGELEVGAWIPAPPRLEAIFGPEGEPTWRKVVRSAGGKETGLENQPPDPSWN